MAGTKRMKKKIIKMLESGPKSTSELYEELNIQLKHGVTMNQLGNVLGKSAVIEKIGYEDLRSLDGERVCTWRLKG